ncbi:Predicted oxidoreductase [Lutibacter agarilyticus]|uniref:Predicted oxidoreductase n=1 Tax=Lutibacter agarilyticus TaxID=1109740 RepID=A0A238VHI7_9FLAO|nr:aldo/keto reductase [Lutibacter agarilyticus]SNR33862.1 Predicted oxidoreductase [Lutibacter agarilyticus]
MSNTKIGLGLAALGRPEYININDGCSQDKSQEAFMKNALNVLDFAYEKGIRYFDTAPSYGKGEQFLINWNTNYKHADVTLSTKWGYTYVADWELGFSGAHEVKEHSLSKLIAQWEISKKLLPALKIYQVHSATFESGILENKDVLNKLYELKKQTGLQIGITSSGANQIAIIDAALKIKIKNEDLFDSYQVTYNILEQSTHVILKQLIEQQKTVIIKEGLANGRLFKNEKFTHYQEVYGALDTLAKKYNVGADAIVLRFIMDYLEPTYVLSGALSKEHLAQNLKAQNFKLEAKELELLASFKTMPDAYWEERNKLPWS